MMRRTVYIIVLSLLVCSMLAAATKHRKPKTHTVVMEAMVFRPVLTVNSGDTIVWVNKGIVEHTVTSANAGFDSKMIRPGNLWKHTVRNSGNFAVLCSYHPAMTGTLQVK